MGIRAYFLGGGFEVGRNLCAVVVLFRRADRGEDCRDRVEGGKVVVCVDEDVAFELELRVVGEHLILASGALAKVLALYSVVISQFGVWFEDGEEVCKRVEPGTAIHADADTLAGECKRRDDDPVRGKRERVSGRRKTGHGDVNFLPEMERGFPLSLVSEERADIMPEDVVIH